MKKSEKTGELPVMHTAYTAHLRDKVYEKTDPTVITVPGQSMTIQEMVARHRAGLPIDQAKGALYQEGDEPIVDLSKMDLIDRQAYLDSVADALVEVKERLALSAKTKAEKEFLEKVDAAVRDKLANMKDRNVITDVPEEK